MDEKDKQTAKELEQIGDEGVNPTDLVYYPRLLSRWFPALIKEYSGGTTYGILDTFSQLDHKLMRDELSSMVCRCIERNLARSLGVVITQCARRGVGPKALFLRWIATARLYVYASQRGWRDPEVERRIRLIQAWWRAGSAAKKRECLRRFRRSQRYFGPSALRYSRQAGGPEGRYYGWRHALHFLRWNRCRAYQLFRDLMSLGRWGDCAWQAYVDTLGEGEDSVTRDCDLWRIVQKW
jgi:hypothetical protein